MTRQLRENSVSRSHYWERTNKQVLWNPNENSSIMRLRMEHSGSNRNNSILRTTGQIDVCQNRMKAVLISEEAVEFLWLYTAGCVLIVAFK
jgi:hypothetical protein